MAAPPGEVLRLASSIESGDVPFPYKKAYLRPAEYYFDNLQRRPYVEVVEESLADLRARRRGARPAVPWGFGGRGVSFVVGEASFAEVDLLTDHFTEEARMAARVRGRLPPREAWRTPAVAARVAGKAVDRAREAQTAAPTPEMLREACYEVVPECTLFKVSLACEIYRFFLAGGSIDEARVLDPFAGWGDRALGAAGAGVGLYVGVDPNPALAPGYEAIADFAAAQGAATAVRHRCVPFEDYGPAEQEEDFPARPAGPAGPGAPAGADLVFGSPPFFDYEVYVPDGGAGAAAQSISAGGRPRAFGAWLRDWLLPVTDRAWDALAPGKHLAYYLADVRGEITGPLRAHMEARGRKFRGVIACRRGDRRPIPLWVWQKNK